MVDGLRGFGLKGGFRGLRVQGGLPGPYIAYMFEDLCKEIITQTPQRAGLKGSW